MSSSDSENSLTFSRSIGLIGSNKKKRKRKNGLDDRDDFTSSKKQKIEENEEEKVILKLEESTGASGPVLALFPGITPSDNTEYQLYTRSETKNMKSAKKHVLFGETDRVEFVGTNYNDGFGNLENCRYMVGIHDKATGTITLKEISLFVMSCTVKATKPTKKEDPLPQTKYWEAKVELGKSFGSKKTIRRIKNIEKNVVHMDMLAAPVDTIVKTIEEKTSAMPTIEQVKVQAEEDRPIPPHNINATVPSEVYKLEDIVTTAELDTIRIKPLLEAKQEEITKFLPIKNSQFIMSRLTPLIKKASNPNIRKSIRILVYVSYMMAFMFHKKNIAKPQEMSKLLGNPPTIILNNLYKQFTEDMLVKNTKKQSHKMTPNSESKLICYLLCLCLILDNYQTEPHVLAEDLSMNKLSLYEHFKMLGCKLESEKSVKVAKLQAPPLFRNSKY